MFRLLVAVLLPVHFTAACQQASLVETLLPELKAPAAVQRAYAPVNAFSFKSPESHLTSALEKHDDLFVSSLQPQIRRSPQTARPTAAPRKLTLHGSMVGYIDNPIPQSQARVRFDAALNDPTPDRAEFFYAKCGCYGQAAVRDATDPSIRSLYDPNTPGPGFGNPPPDTINFQQVHFTGEYAFAPRLSGVLDLPLRWVQPQGSGTAQAFSSSGGIGDLRLGLKYAVLARERTLVTLQLKSSVPTGDASRGLGTNHATLEPMLLLYRALSDRLVIEGQFGDTHPLSGSSPVPTATGAGTFAGDVLTYGAGPSYTLIARNTFTVSPVVELVAWHVYGGYKTGGAASTDGANIVNLKFGGRLGFAQHHSVYAGYGRGLSSAIWYQDIARIEYRYSF